jgi:hypothetical protein
MLCQDAAFGNCYPTTFQHSVKATGKVRLLLLFIMWAEILMMAWWCWVVPGGHLENHCALHMLHLKEFVAGAE